MARKQVLVQLDDAQIAWLDEAARASHASRSALIREAIAGLIRSRALEEMETRYAQGYLAIPDGDPAWDEAVARMAAEQPPSYEA